MTAVVKELIAFFLRFSGIPWIVRNRISRNKVSIVVFHDPAPQALAGHLAYLAKYYHVIPLQKLVEAMESGKSHDIAPKSMVITIDDGHAGNYRLLEIFRQHRICPTIYLTSHIVDTRRHFWQNKVAGFKNSCNRLSHQQFLSRLKNDFGFTPDQEFDTRRTLNRREIDEMSPWVDFQSHGQYHFSLPACDENTMREEIAGSQKTLEKLLGKQCGHFAYPFGDYSSREAAYLKECGYRSGRTTDPGWNDRDSDPYRLKVLAMIPDNASKNMLCAQLTGLPNFAAYFIHRVMDRFKLIF
ncbi:MAG: polysaccharide deacetylase family protein [Desulfosalsimonadaceae bacterium]